MTAVLSGMRCVAITKFANRLYAYKNRSTMLYIDDLDACLQLHKIVIIHLLDYLVYRQPKRSSAITIDHV